MKRLLLFIFLTGFAATLYGQGQGNIWAFGGFMGIDFNTGSPVVTFSSLDHQEGCASIADKNGNLLFYTDGDRIYNRDHVIMPNGVLFYGLPYPLFGAGPIWSGTQSAMIVPMPNDSMKYYVFSLANANYGYLWYSVVDMTLDAGKGDVVPAKKNVVLNDAGTLSEKMTATSGNNCNVWLMVHDRVQNKYMAYEVTAHGVQTTPVVSNAVARTSDIGVIKFAPNRRRMVAASYGGLFIQRPKGLSLYDFDPNTGVLSNAMPVDTFTSYYGACFSPDNQKLYATSGEQYSNWGTTNRNLFQFNLAVPTPVTMLASKTFLGVADADLERGPDGKIYFGEVGANSMGVVNFPDLPGAACNPVPNALTWFYPNRLLYGLPNDIVVLVDSAKARGYHIKACFRDSVVLEANPGGFNFIWDDGSNDINRTVKEPGTYTVRFQSGCKELTDTFTVTMARFPLINADTACPGARTARIIAAARDETNFNYTWKDETGRVLLEQLSSTGSTLTSLNPGKYTLRLSTTAGCDTTFTVTVEGHPPIAVTINPDHGKIRYGDSIQVQASGAYYYTWWPSGTVSIDTIPNPFLSPRAPTVYTVLGLNEAGCSDTARVKIDIDYTMPDFIPNAFSPNGDGLNDIFRIENITYQKLLAFRVFNRWGSMVYESADITKGWDGTEKGKPCDLGTYYYMISLAYPDGTVKNYKGEVILMR